MEDDVKLAITAVVCLTALEVVNLLTAKYDSSIILAIGALIGSIAGYEAKAWRVRRRARRA